MFSVALAVLLDIREDSKSPPGARGTGGTQSFQLSGTLVTGSTESPQPPGMGPPKRLVLASH